MNKLLLSFLFFLLSQFLSFSFAQVVLESKLPIINITTLGQKIVSDYKIVADIKVIDNATKLNNITDAATFSSKIGIELRGQTSLSLSERLPFSVETRKSDGFLSDDVKLLGMPKENDWAFIAPYSDKTLIRDAFTYKIAKEIMPWAPGFKFAELVLNNDYQGVYMITEKIKKSKNRVNIDPMNQNENAGDSLTGGYIFSLDKLNKGDNYFYSTFNFLGSSAKPYYIINYPKPDLITNEQNKYIINYVNDFEKLMYSAQYNDVNNGYPSKMEVDTFVNFFLINELTKNVDGYRLSTFFKKNKNSINPKLSIASVWDYNIALGNAYYCEADKTYGWAYNFNSTCPNDYYAIPAWLPKLAKDSYFNTKMKNRWKELRQKEFRLDRIYFIIDSLKNEIGDEAIARNFKKYDILNKKVWPNPQAFGSYQNEITYLKNWLTERIKWIDGQFGFINTSLEITEDEDSITIFPNPASDFVHIQSEPSPYTIEIYNQLGQLILSQKNIETPSLEIPISGLNSGIYFVKLYLKEKIVVKQFLKN